MLAKIIRLVFKPLAYRRLQTGRNDIHVVLDSYSILSTAIDDCFARNVEFSGELVNPFIPQWFQPYSVVFSGSSSAAPEDVSSVVTLLVTGSLVGESSDAALSVFASSVAAEG